MKNKIKTVLCMLLIFAMGLSLCACEGGEKEKENLPPQEQPPQAEEKELSADNTVEINYGAEAVKKPEGVKTILNTAFFNNSMYLLGLDGNGNTLFFSTPLDEIQWTEHKIAIEAVSPDSYMEINGMMVDESSVYISGMSWDEDGNELDVLRVYDRESGEQTKEFNLEDMGYMFRPQWLKTANGLICVSDGIAVLIKEDGTVETLTDESTYFAAQVQDKVILCIAQGEEKNLVELDGETGELKKLCAVNGRFKPYMDCGSYISEGPVIMADSDSVQEINPETGETADMLYWNDIGVAASSGIQSMYVTADKEMYLPVSDVFSDKTEIYKICHQDGGTRKTLVVSSGAGVGGVYTNDAIAKFNRENGEYVVRQLVYNQEDADKILTQIIAGEGPDVFYIGSTTDRESAFTRVSPGKNLFVDLMPYLESDPDIKKEDFLPGVLESMTEDGHIYAMHPAIQAISISAPKEFADALENWDMEKLKELSENLPEGYTLFYTNREGMMEYLCTFASVHFVNKSEGTCSFDDPDFAAWLEIIKNAEPYDWDNSEGYALFPCYAGNNIPRMSREAFGDYEYVGFPSSEGGINYLLSSVGGYSIMADSENKEAAWEYIKILLSYEIQDSLRAFGYPVMAKNFDESMEMEINSEYGMDGVREDAEKLKAIIADSAGMCEMNAVSDIIMEEAEKYFADQKPLDETVQMIQSRASIYLAEQKQ